MNKTAVSISVALTVFALMVIGGVIFTVRAAAGRAAAAGDLAASSAATAAPASTAPALDPALQQTIAARDAAYQQEIAQANARLAEAQQQEQSLQAQIDALKTVSAQPEPAAPAAQAITPQAAVQLASTAIHQTRVYTVESASYRGAQAYKVTFSSGTVVYVGLDGSILATQPAPAASNNLTSQPAGPASGFGEHDSHELSSGGHDD